jgi:hypothetical protein
MGPSWTDGVRPCSGLGRGLYRPTCAVRDNDQGSRPYVDFVVRRMANDVPLYLYHLSGRGLFALDGENVDPDDVRHRKTVLQVNWARHFNP